MRRRSKRAPNDSEPTGKIGQEMPTNQPSRCGPLRERRVSATATQSSTSADSPQIRASGRRKHAVVGRIWTVTRHGDAAAVGVPYQTAPCRRPRTRRQAGARDATGVAFCCLRRSRRSRREPPRGYVVLTIGLPGSGKTTWFKRRGVTPLSSDMLRSILFDDITEQRYQGLVFSTLRSLLRARLIAKMPWNYVDATNLSPHERRQWIKMAKSFGYDVQAVFFDVPFEVCMERNRRRERR